jgi:hypothetical protein
MCSAKSIFFHFFKAQKEQDSDHERWYTIAFQIFIPYLIAGFGMVSAGIVLDKVQVSPSATNTKS